MYVEFPMVLASTEQNGLPSPTSTSMSLRFDFEQPETSMKKLHASDIRVDNALPTIEALTLGESCQPAEGDSSLQQVPKLSIKSFFQMNNLC